jgi:hypothetical protein
MIIVVFICLSLLVMHIGNKNFHIIRLSQYVKSLEEDYAKTGDWDMRLIMPRDDLLESEDIKYVWWVHLSRSSYCKEPDKMGGLLLCENGLIIINNDRKEIPVLDRAIIFLSKDVKSNLVFISDASLSEKAEIRAGSECQH